MDFTLSTLLKYRKRHARKFNNFKAFIPSKDKVLIDSTVFGLSNTRDIDVVESRRDYKRARRSESKFIYFKKRGLLFFNENGSEKKFGEGGIIAVFSKNQNLSSDSFRVINASSPLSENNPTPTPDPEPTQELDVTPDPDVTSEPELTPATEATLQNGSNQSGEISYRGEKVLFLLDIPTGHIASVEASGDTYPVVDIVDSEGNLLSVGSWSKTTSYVRGDEPIYAQVYGYGGNQGSYNIQMTSKKYMTETEIMRASPVINGDGSHEGNIKDKGEVDYYKIEADENDLVSLSISSDYGLYPLLDIVDGAGDVVSSLSKHNGYGSDFYNMNLFEFPSASDTFYLRIKSQVPTSTGAYKVISSIDSRSSFKDEVIRLTNTERSNYGLQPLNYDPLLEAAAQAHVDDMDSSGRYLAHTGSNGSSPQDRIELAGYQAAWHVRDDGSMMYPSQENAAYGQRSPAEVVDGWMNSHTYP